MRDNQNVLSNIQMRVGKPLVDGGKVAEVLDQYLFGDHQAGAQTPSRCGGHRPYGISKGLALCMASQAVAVPVHGIFREGEDLVEWGNHSFCPVDLLFFRPTCCSAPGSP